jgi:hypothetical protein
MRAHHAMIAVAAVAFGVWIAVAVAQGDLSSSPCAWSPPRHPVGFTGGTGTGIAGQHCPRRPTGHKRHEGSGERHDGSGEHRRGHRREARRARHRRLTFFFSVRVRHGLTTGPLKVIGYSTHASRPHGRPDRCTPRLVRRPNVRKGQVARVHLLPPAGGWCTGRYHVAVSLTRRPGSH